MSSEPLVVVVNAAHILTFFIGWSLGKFLSQILNDWYNERKSK